MKKIEILNVPYVRFLFLRTSCNDKWSWWMKVDSGRKSLVFKFWIKFLQEIQNPFQSNEIFEEGNCCRILFYISAWQNPLAAFNLAIFFYECCFIERQKILIDSEEVLLYLFIKHLVWKNWANVFIFSLRTCHKFFQKSMKNAQKRFN